jgi:hypothetical protein
MKTRVLFFVAATELLSLSLLHAADLPRFPIPIPPAGTYVLYKEKYEIIGGVGSGWFPIGKGVHCSGDYNCTGLSGTVVPPSGYQFCSAKLVSASVSDGTYFVGSANSDGTLSYNSSLSGDNHSIIVNMTVQFMKIGYSGTHFCEAQGASWECGAGTAGGPHGCKFYALPHE